MIECNVYTAQLAMKPMHGRDMHVACMHIKQEHSIKLKAESSSNNVYTIFARIGAAPRLVAALELTPLLTKSEAK